jgi:hypothetical protein
MTMFWITVGLGLGLGAACVVIGWSLVTRAVRAFMSGLTVLVLVSGCANGPIYWTRPGADLEAFSADHFECARGATIAYGIGSEDAYKRCLKQKKWTRVQGRGTEMPDVPFFRGFEDDDQFGDGLPVQQLQTTGREPLSGDAYQCARARRTMSQRPPPGVVCP